MMYFADSTQKRRKNVMGDRKGGARVNISNETILKALVQSGFNQSSAAGKLGKSRSWLVSKLSGDELLREKFDDARQLLLDSAESQLQILVDSGDFNAIKFVLSTRGRKRGYGTSIELTGDSTKPIKIEATMTVEESAQLFAEMRDQK